MEPDPGDDPAAAPTADDSPPPVRARRRVWRWILGVAGVLVVALVVALAVFMNPGDRYPLPTSHTWERHRVDGRLVDRHWIVGVPEDLPDGRHPAIVVLHGAFGDRTSVAADTDLLDFTGPRGIVTAFPQGLWGVWNSGGCCLPSMAFGVDDVAFLDHVVDGLGHRRDVDPDRIYVVGASNGGMMAARYACQGHASIAGAAAVTGTPWNADGCRERSVPMLFIAGTADSIIPYGGGRTLLSTMLSGRSARAARANAAEYAAANGCDPTPGVTTFRARTLPSEPTTTWTRREWRGCRAAVELATIHGAEHTWPWGGDWGGSQEVLRFFGLL